MKTQRFGTEVEMEGLTPVEARAVVSRYFGADYDHLGRRWDVVDDSSIQGGFELVTPPIWYADIPTLQELFRELRLSGARRSRRAGLHVHVEATAFSAQQLQSLINLYASHSELLVRMLNVYSRRRIYFCQPITSFAETVETLDPRTVDELQRIWYEVSGAVNEPVARWNSSRYTELNLNSYFAGGTVEFRAFNSTNHAGKLRAMVVLVLALVERAKTHPGVFPLVSPRVDSLDSCLAAAEGLFVELGLHAREFLNVRSHFLRNVHRSWARPVAGSGRRSLHYHLGGTSCDGGSYSELLDELWETGVFFRPDVQEVLAAVRKRGKPPFEAAWQYGPQEEDEAFAERFVRDLEGRGVGVIEEIPE